MHFDARGSSWLAFSWLLGCCLLAGCRTAGPDRLRADAKINGQPVRFVYDTGSATTAVFTPPAKRLGLQVIKPPAATKPPPGQVLIGSTGFCRFSVGGDAYTLKLATVHLPWPWRWFCDMDGVIGWPDISDDYLEIDAAAGVLRSLDKWPEDTNGWSQFSIYPRTGVLALQTPRADGKTGVWELDTGDAGSVSLAPARWEAWRATHPHGHRHWSPSYMPGSGVGFYRQFTADELAIGSLRLRKVTVQKANQTQMGIVAGGDVLEGSLGIEALRSLDVLINQKDHLAWLRPRPEAAATNAMSGGKAREVAPASAHSNVRLDLRERECQGLAEDGVTCYGARQWDEAAQDFRQLGEVDVDVENYTQFFIWVMRAHAGQREAATTDLAAYLAQSGQQRGGPWQTDIGAFLLGRMAEADFLRAAGGGRDDQDVCHCEAWFYAGMKRRLDGDLATARDYFGKCLATRQADHIEYQFAVAELKM